MTTGHELRTLVLAASHLLPLLLELSTLDVRLGQSAVAPDPHNLSTRSALPCVACAPRTRVCAALGPFLGTGGLTLTAVGPSVDAVVVFDTVTVTLAGVVAAGQQSGKKKI